MPGVGKLPGGLDTEREQFSAAGNVASRLVRRITNDLRDLTSVNDIGDFVNKRVDIKKVLTGDQFVTRLQ